MKITFDTKGNDKQKLAAKYWLDKTTEKILFGGAKYGGKSYLGANLIFGDAFIYPETRYFIARDSLTDLRRYTIPTIFEVINDWGINPSDYMIFNGQDSYFELYNKSKVFLLDAKHLPRDPDFHRFGSVQMTRGWCEEIGQMNSKAIDHLWLTVGRWNNQKYGLKKKMLMTCNPHKGYGYVNYYKPHKENKLEDNKKFIIALPQDNKSGDKDYIKSIIENKDIAERERLGFGNWEYDDDPACLITYNSILDMFTNSFVYDDDTANYITADIAMQGSDRFVLIVWKGLTAIDIKIIQKCDATEVEKNIQNLAEQYHVPRSCIAYDADGLGTFLRGYLKGAYPINGNGKVIGKENYSNLKSQLHYLLSKAINGNHIYFKCLISDNIKGDIIEELEYIKRYKADTDGKLRILPKEQIKELIGRSPDFSDAMAYRMIFELLKPYQAFWNKK